MTSAIETNPSTTAPPADLAIGAFSDQPPWIVDPASMPWRKTVAAVRWVTRRQIPELIRPRKVPSGTRVFRVMTHLGAAVGLWAVGARRKGGHESKADISRRIRIAAEHLGP